jgi:hypothetical protein
VLASELVQFLVLSLTRSVIRSIMKLITWLQAKRRFHVVHRTPIVVSIVMCRLGRLAKVDNSREVHGEPARGLAFVIGAKSLRDDLERYKDTPRYQRLVIPYAPGEDPDDGFRSVNESFHFVVARHSGRLSFYSTVPYEKGT